MTGMTRPSATPTGRAEVERAVASVGAFADPVALYAAQRAWSENTAWAREVLGVGAGLSFRALNDRQVAALAAAARLDADWLAERRARRPAPRPLAADSPTGPSPRETWEATAARLPVPVQVRHNWSRGHYERQVTGRDHVVVTTELVAGRLRRRAWQALCETPSTAGDLVHLDRDPDSTYATDRAPSCTRCLRTAEQLAARG